MGREAPYLRSVSPKFLDGCRTLLISMHLHIQLFKVGLFHGIPVAPLLLWRRYYLVLFFKEGGLALSLRSSGEARNR